MSLKVKLLEDMKNAMRDKNEIKKNTVQMVRAAVLQFEKDNKTELDESGVLEIISKEVKKRKDSIPEYLKGGRNDIVETLNKEIEILLEYLPEQLSEEELQEIIQISISEVGATSLKDIGKIMSSVLPKVKGRADGKAINQIIKKILN